MLLIDFVPRMSLLLPPVIPGSWKALLGTMTIRAVLVLLPISTAEITIGE